MPGNFFSTRARKRCGIGLWRFFTLRARVGLRRFGLIGMGPAGSLIRCRAPVGRSGHSETGRPFQRCLEGTCGSYKVDRPTEVAAALVAAPQKPRNEIPRVASKVSERPPVFAKPQTGAQRSADAAPINYVSLSSPAERADRSLAEREARGSGDPSAGFGVANGGMARDGGSAVLFGVCAPGQSFEEVSFSQQMLKTLVRRRMRATPLREIIVLLCVLSPGALVAQTGAQSAPSATQPLAPETPKKDRVLSSEASDALAARVKYEPLPPEPVEPAPPPEEDMPRNEIIRLPKYVVTGDRPPVFNERSLYSKEQLQKLAAQRYLSEFHRNLSRYRIGRDDEKFAMLTYFEEERLKNMGTTDGYVALYRASGNEAKAEEVKEEAYSTFVRKPEVGAPKQPMLWTDRK